MSRLIEIIKDPTTYIKPEKVERKVKEVIAKAVAKKEEATNHPAKEEQEIPEVSEEQIKHAAELNANMYAALIETPLTAFNKIYCKKIKRRKAIKNIKDAKALEKELDKIDREYNENQEDIDLTDVEFSRLRKICELKAQRDGGKTNETLDLVTVLVGAVIKRASIFF